jgi:Nitrile hydratase, alpha chain
VNLTPDNYAKAMGKLIAQAWQDPSFVAQLKADPHGVLAGFGIDVPTTVKLNVVESQPSDFYIVLPVQPKEGISEEHLAAIAGGGSTTGSAGTAGTAACPVSTAGSAGTAGTTG